MSASMEALRVPPHSVEAEQAVLGGLLLSNAAWDRIADVVAERDFYRADHRLLWRVVVGLIEANKPADVLTVHEELKRRGHLAEVGGLQYLHQLASRTPSAANVRRYAEIVREKSLRRAVIEAATVMLDAAYGAEAAPVVIERAQSHLLDIGTRAGERDPAAVGSVLTRVMEGIDARHRGEVRRVPTGLADLDRMLHGGLRGGRLYVIGGRPSSGKSALALQIAMHAATTGHPAMVASLEMSDEENGERAIAAASKVDLDRIITGTLSQGDWDRVGSALGELNGAPLYFDDTPAVTLPHLRARVRRMHHRNGIRLLVVDYLQLMSAESRGENRNQEVGALAEGLKSLAKELDIAVVALSQMNRECERRTNRRGIVADLRDSGGIDAAADFIAFVYREEMYDEMTPAKGVAEIIVRKSRQGKTGTVYALFHGEHARFESLERGFVPTYSVAETSRPLRPARKSFAEVE